MVSHSSDRVSASEIHSFWALPYEYAFAQLGREFSDEVTAATFPEHHLRFRNDALLPLLGRSPTEVSDADFIAAFGEFKMPHVAIAMRYHGHQFGQYNPSLGDGRGFLYGQVRGTDGNLYDLGTKGSGTTPYSRGGDGRLTLKGGVREVLAAEMLHVSGVNTSRCLSLIETGEGLWRGDEPSPTRSSVMVRFNETHVRFGTFERLHYQGRPDLVQILLDHVITYYYPHLQGEPDAYARFYAELVQRTARLVAQWVTAGFCHAVLNTDNMSITGESFDYGPYAFIDRYDPNFTAAYFDHYRRYSYANQPAACYWNLEMLKIPLKLVIPEPELDAGLATFGPHLQTEYRARMLQRLGFNTLPDDSTGGLADELIEQTLLLLLKSDVGYTEFFMWLRRNMNPLWRQDDALILSEAPSSERFEDRLEPALFQQWRQTYHRVLTQHPVEAMENISQRLRQHNPLVALIRPEIEKIWEPIVENNDWEPFQQLLQQIWSSVEAPDIAE